MKMSIIYLCGSLISTLKSIESRLLTVYKTKLVNKTGHQPLWIGSNTTLNYPDNIFVGNNSYVNGGWLLANKNSKIVIGKNCLISFNVHIRTYSHNIKETSKPIIQQGDFEKDIIIGNNVWIGHGAQIMPGVRIGDNCVVGAGAVVTKSFEDNLIIAGVPARAIRDYI
ncbi:acyltransferase [Jeotgalibacillus haloalkalitolerans]|uniref:Acyltransferase n=1 Tax=Jeotgalibacillus haloalkalitolerans TaxID=3104292 RepID=A0ABU5KKS2_9BACL|nr:acyltransferase [Jeotgalibacillus sp. HH7-29]MDZ5711315.1 acyltransferase [Jeotgalibacillus sp. HH7-29]